MCRTALGLAPAYLSVQQRCDIARLLISFILLQRKFEPSQLYSGEDRRLDLFRHGPQQEQRYCDTTATHSTTHPYLLCEIVSCGSFASSGSDSPDTASSWIRLQFNDSPVGVRTTPEFQDEPRGAVLSCRSQCYSKFIFYFSWIENVHVYEYPKPKLPQGQWSSPQWTNLVWTKEEREVLTVRPSTDLKVGDFINQALT